MKISHDEKISVSSIIRNTLCIND